MKTAQQANDAWKASGPKATTNYAAGVAAYNGDWAAATVAQESVLLQNVTAAIQNGTWRNKVNATATSGWKTATQAKAPNFTTGFTAGAPNQLASATKLMNELASIVPNLPPRGTFEQNKLRATTLMDALHARRGSLGAK